jgi:hypothetical protein
LKDPKIIRLVAFPSDDMWTPEVEEAWSKDYSDFHMGTAIKAGGLKKVTRYKLMPRPKGMPAHKYGEEQDYPKYLSIYEYETEKDFDAYNNSSEHRIVHQHYVDQWRSKGVKTKWVAEYEFMQTWEKK